MPCVWVPSDVTDLRSIFIKSSLSTASSTRIEGAVDFVERIEGKRVGLINGGQLADFMIDHGHGVKTTKIFANREFSRDFFDESEG